MKRRASREIRVRELGFDPAHLTPEEQTELVEMYEAFPDEMLEEEPEVEWW